jgi:hypothetical protein
VSVAKNKDAVKNDSNYMVLTFSYDKKIILPYKDALTLINSLEKAEIYDECYGKPSIIKDFNKDSLSISLMGFQEYAEIKLRSLLIGNQDGTQT